MRAVYPKHGRQGLPGQGAGLDNPPCLAVMERVAALESAHRAQRLEFDESMITIHLGGGTPIGVVEARIVKGRPFGKEHRPSVVRSPSIPILHAHLLLLTA